MIRKQRTYSELISLHSFVERFKYLKLYSFVGSKTFGAERYLNQKFYKSIEWQRIKRQVIIRDLGMDLGILEVNPNEKLIVHHMNPLDVSDIVNVSDYLLNPEYLITVTHNTHNAIHYGNKDFLYSVPIERTIGDTCPWKVKVQGEINNGKKEVYERRSYKL